MMRNGINSYLTSLVMVLALLLPTALFAQTAYLDEKGSLKTLEESATAITSSMTTWSAGWYVVSDNVTIDERITVNGDVHLILADGATLNANKGIGVSSSATFNVYAQSENEATMGALVANASAVSNSAGIGGTNRGKFGNIIINGGKITAVGRSSGIGGGIESTSGNITINGGIISATAGEKYSGAGIGGGPGIYGNGGGYVTSITLNGGIISATGALTGQGGAGIGTGYGAISGTMTITISRGVKKIVSTKGYNSECIGQGQGSQTTVNVIFKDGETAVDGEAKAELFYDSGEGEQRSIRTKALNHHIVISDDIKSQVTAYPEYALTGEMVTLSIGAAVDVETIKLNGGAVSLLDAGNGQYTFVMPDGDVNVTAGASDTYSVVIPEQMEIVSSTNPPDGDGKYISGTVVEFRLMFPYTATGVSDGTISLNDVDGIYSVTVGTSDINITATINHNSLIDLSEAPNNFTALDGDVLSGTTQYTVTIENGAKVTLSDATINGGIICDGSATIVLEKENTVKGAKNKAGIQVGGEGTTLSIRGDGSLTASGNYGSAGIGLDQAWDVDAYGGDILIEGGIITAIGGIRGAGIGTGIAHGYNTARLGNITIKGGSVKTIDGGSANGIGAGDTYFGCTNEIGVITIYDNVDLVDASSVGKDIVYMHDENNVTASKTDYFNITEDGAQRIIVPKDDTDYSISIADDIEHGMLTGAMTAKYMEKVTISVTPDFGYRIRNLVVKDANNNDVVIDGNTFLMPKSNVTVSAIFEQVSQGTTEFMWVEAASVTVKNVIYDGETTVNIETYENYKIVSKDNNDLVLEISSANIPYSGGTGTFKDAYGTVFSTREPSGFYDIILTDLGDDRWSVSILKTVAALDNVPDQTYTGSEIKPEPLVLAGSLSLTEGTDYEYSYTNNINVGTATVTVTFKGDYAEFGSVSKSFNITKATPTVEPPTSANPKFAGNCVELVNPGITDFGVILYSIKEDEGYSSDIPCADAAGNYTVYYKVEERDNWSSVEGSVDVSVVNEEFTVTFVDAEGETISSDKYPYGTPADRVKLPPENPEKADDDMYAYTFAGWSPEIQEVTGAKTYRPIYDKTRIGFGPITIAKDSSSAIIDGMSRDPIDKTIKDCMIKGEVTLYRHFAAGKYSTLVLPFSTFTGAFSGVSFYSFRGVEKENGVWKTVVFGYVDKENEGNKLIEANTPYIVVADADMDDLVVKDGVLFNADDPKSSYGATLTCSEETCDEVPDENKSWQFVGTYNYRQWDSGNNVEEIGTTYGFAGAAGNGGMEIGKFGKIKEGAYIYPMRAYLYYAGGNSGESRSMAPALFKAAPSVASIDELPESMDVVIRGEEGTTVIGSINTRTGEFRSADNRWFDLNGRYLGNKKPTVKGTYYNNGKKVIVK